MENSVIVPIEFLNNKIEVFDKNYKNEEDPEMKHYILGLIHAYSDIIKLKQNNEEIINHYSQRK